MTEKIVLEGLDQLGPWGIEHASCVAVAPTQPKVGFIGITDVSSGVYPVRFDELIMGAHMERVAFKAQLKTEVIVKPEKDPDHG